MKAARGNALFLILIAVALFAALSYAVTQSGRGSGTIQKENDTLRAAQMVQYANDVRTAVQRMVLFGTPLADIQPFYDSGLPGAVFSPAGGGVTQQTAPLGDDAYTDETYTFYIPSDNKAVLDVGTAAPEFLMNAYIKITPTGTALCRAIDRLLGLDDIPGSASGPVWDEAAPGVPMACVRNYSDWYIFYTALYEQ